MKIHIQELVLYLRAGIGRQGSLKSCFNNKGSTPFVDRLVIKKNNYI